MFRSHVPILLSATFLSLGLAGAQDSAELDEPLSKKEAEHTVELAEEALENAKRAQGRDDIPGMEHALENYTRHMSQLELGLHDGNVLHAEREDVAEVVAEATYKHTEVLEGLYEKVPEEGYQGIDRALTASQRSHDTALENLSEKRREELTQRNEGQRPPSSGESSSRSDESLRGSPPSRGPGTVGGPGRSGSPRGGSPRGGGPRGGPGPR